MPAAIKENPELIRRFLRAYAEGIHIFKTRPDAAKLAMEKQLGAMKPDELEESYLETRKLLVVRFTPTPKGVQNVLDELAPKNPKAKTAKGEDFIDLRFVQELDRSGYFDQLK
jgi:ABC-type nitrate/sulfonate/bicarbonate transport system substrate-binding protein